MKNTTTKSPGTLTKRDITFLKFLDDGTYSGTSTLQLPHRDRLQAIIALFDILFYIIDACYQLLKKRKNAGKAAVENLANALTGRFPDVTLDFSKVKILGGSLAAPCASMHQNYGSSKLSFSWSRCTQCNSNESDELMAMIYCPERHEFWCEQNLGITRGDRFCTLDVPMEFDAKKVHVWLAYRSVDGRDNSNSSYMGEVLIKSDPDADY